MKTVVAFRETLAVLGVADPGGVWMVGNSIRSDINPALEAGARAILVEVAEPWEFDLVEPVSDDFVRVRTFPDAVDFLLQLED
jgi:putative hydrolase of the HAD superfamily